MTSTTDANSYAKSKSLAGHALHGAAKGGVPAEYGIMYIPHKVLIAADGTVVKNGTNLVLPGDLDALLARKEDKSSAKSE